MNKKILVVGGVAGGASAAARVRRLDENAEVIIFDRGPNVSFSNCALPYHLSGIVEKSEDLVLLNKDDFKGDYNIETRVNNEVLSIDRDKKEILVRDLIRNVEYKESYDKLILSPGAKPIVPNFNNIDEMDIYTLRDVDDVVKIKEDIIRKGLRKISVIGGGFIGIETAENLKLAGCDVSLIEAERQIMKPFDYDMVQILHKELYDNGINLLLGDRVNKFEDKNIILDSGKVIETEAVIMAIGVIPEIKLAEESGLIIAKTGGIKVNEKYQTNDENIYAIGDAIEVKNNLSCKEMRLPLAGIAQKQARLVGSHICGEEIESFEVIGSSIIKVFNMNAASTGLNEAMIKSLNLDIDYDFINIIPPDKVSLMPESNRMHFKLLFERPSGRVLGAQAIGRGNVDKRIDIIATVIKFKGNLKDLIELEFAYAPPFGTAKDVVNLAGIVGMNILENKYKQIKVSEIRSLVEQGAYMLDVRKKKDFEKSHIKGAINIPMDEIRDRLDEIPRDKPVYIYCRSGKRSYNIVVALQQIGFNNVYNVSGSFLGLSYYEYFNDMASDRESILTGYNFN